MSRDTAAFVIVSGLFLVAMAGTALWPYGTTRQFVAFASLMWICGLSDEHEDWLTVKEFAATYKFAESTVRGWIRQGRAVGQYRDGDWRVRMVAGKLSQPKRVAHHQGVYFVECHEFIKIGFAEDVTHRFKFINQASPFPCRPLAYLPAPDRDSAKAIEREWHHRFAGLHERHEWFRAVQRLREAITVEALPWPTRNCKVRSPK
jgi:hypothetical protein